MEVPLETHQLALTLYHLVTDLNAVAAPAFKMGGGDLRGIFILGGGEIILPAYYV